MRTLIDNEIYNSAKRKVGFRIHFTIFLILISVNWIIWAFTWQGYPWPVWPTLGWSIGILFHYLGVYHINKAFVTKHKQDQDFYL